MTNIIPPTLNAYITPEQHDKLRAYVALLLKWNKTYNLIGNSTENEVWQRHIWDSAQLLPHMKEAKTVLDFGTGAGLPSVVLAICGTAHVTACERIQKKTDFIREVRRQLDLAPQLTVLPKDVTSLSLQEMTFEIITARAVSTLQDLVKMSQPLLAPNGRFLFLKGQDVGEELKILLQNYNMTYARFSSITFAKGEIIELVPA